MSLAAKLRELRADKKVSLQVVADAVGVTKPHIWELEKGKSKNPSLELLKQLATYYGVTLDYLANMGEGIETNARYNALLRKLNPDSMSDADWKIIESAMDFAVTMLEKGKTDDNDKSRPTKTR